MKLAFLYHPVSDLKQSLSYYRALGFEESWREGEHTVALKIPGSTVQLMIEDEDVIDIPVAGGIFVVDSVDAFYAANKATLNFVDEPKDIPPGRYAIYKDPDGNVIRILDMSKENQ